MSEQLTEGAAAGAAVDANVDEPITTAGGDAAVAEPVAPPAAAVAPAVAAIDWTDPSVLQVLDSRAASMFQTQMQPLLPLLEQVLGAGDPAAAGGPGTLDPWDENFGGSLDARFQSLEQKMESWLNRLSEPFMAREQAEAVAEGEQRLQDVLVDDISRHGEFSAKPEVDQQARQLVRTLSGQIYDGLAGRFGGHDQVVNQGLGPRLSEAATVQAAATIRGLLQAERAAGAATEANRLATLAGVDGEPGAAATGVQTIPPVRARSIEEGLRSVTARHADAIRNGTP